MKPVSYLFALICLVALFASPTSAYADDYKKWSEDDLRERGTALLQAGQRLEKAIAMLSALAERKPDNARYQMLLGCACAGRLEALACAEESATYEQGVKRLYEKRWKIWQQMQSEPSMPLYGKPQPVAPAKPTTPDDQQGFRLDNSAVVRRRAELAAQTLRGLRSAYHLSRKMPAETRQEISFACGWGLLLLYHSAKDIIQFSETPLPQNFVPVNAKPALSPDLPLTRDEFVACLQDCVECDPKRVDYWQTLAYANAPDFLTNPGMGRDEDKIAESKVNRPEAALDALRHALKLKRDDANTLYEMALLAYFSPTDDTLNSLKKLTVTQHQNAVFFYQLAAAYSRKANAAKSDAAAARMQADAIAAVEAGNAAPQLEDITLFLPAPRLLKAAWSYRRIVSMGKNANYLSEISDLMKRNAQRNIASKSYDAAMQTGAIETELAIKLANNFYDPDLEDSASFIQTTLFFRGFMAYICGSNAYYKLLKPAVTADPTAEHIALLKRYAPMKAYWEAWDEAITGR